MRSVKENLKLISQFCICIILLISIVVVDVKEVYGAESITLTRENLQDFVVSTALKYYYKKGYSDYEQYSLDKFNRFYQVNVNNSPEEISVANAYKIDCASFAMMVYLQSLGYSMTENDLYSAYHFHKIHNNPVEQNGGFYIDYRTNSSMDDIELLFEQYNKAWWTDQLLLSAGYAATNNMDYFNKLFVYSTGDYVLLDEDISASNLTNIPKTSSITSIPSYGEENYEEYKTALINEIKDTIQPGDILLYATENNSGSIGAHVMVYVDNATNGKDEVGFIHSTGVDLKYEKDENGEETGELVQQGYDVNDKGELLYGVRYAEFYNYLENLYTEEKNPKYFVIIRPINYFLDSIDENATVTSDVLENKIQYENYKENFNKYLSNTISRDVSRYLNIEQYVTSVGSKKFFPYGIKEKPLSKYSSVGKNDQLRYNIDLSNQAYAGFCSKNKYTTIEECSNAGYDWVYPEYISDISIVVPLPTNTTFVEDSCSKDYGQCLYDSTNNIVTFVTDSPIDSDGNPSSAQFNFLINFGTDMETVEFKNIKINYVIEELGSGEAATYTMYMPDISIDVEEYNYNNDIIVGVEDENGSSYAGVYTKVENGSCSTNTNMVDYIKCVYSEIKGIDLTNLSNIENLENYFTPVTAKISSSETKPAYIKSVYIENDMLIKGLYGGRELLGNFLLDREATHQKYYFEYGDIIVTYFDNTPQIYLFTGLNKVDYAYTFMTIKDGSLQKIGETVETTTGGYTISGGKSGGFALSRELFAQDLFAVFRPSKLYSLDTSGDIVNPDNPDLGDKIELLIVILVISLGGIIYSITRKPKFTIDL